MRVNISGPIDRLLAGLDKTNIAAQSIAGLPITDGNSKVIGAILEVEGDTFYGYVDTEMIPQVEQYTKRTMEIVAAGIIDKKSFVTIERRRVNGHKTDQKRS